MSEPVLTERVPAVFAQLLSDYLLACGESPSAVLGSLHAPEKSYGSKGIRVDQWRLMLERAADHLGDPALGLRLGETMRPHHLGTFGYLITACSTLGEVLIRLERYQRLAYDVVSMSTRPGPDFVDIVWDTSYFNPGKLVNETGIAMLIQFCRSLTGLWGAPLLVKFPHPAPVDIQPYLDLFGGEVQFNTDEAAVRASNLSLAVPLTTADPEIAVEMERRAEHLLATLPNADQVVTEVRRATARLLHDGEPNLHTVAAYMHNSSRTVQRRLAAAGTSFRAELLRVRQRYAEIYLRDHGLSISDIAILLGYSEHSAFTRSYKTWTGVSPHEQRQRTKRTSYN